MYRRLRLIPVLLVLGCMFVSVAQAQFHVSTYGTNMGGAILGHRLHND